MKISTKTIIFFASFLILLFTSNNFSQERFEGEITFQITQDDETTSMNYMVKGDQVRIEVPDEENAVILMNVNESKMQILMEDEKMYLEFPVKNYVTGKNLQEENVNNNNVIKTGETKEINGYLCEKFIFEGEEAASESWMTKELGSFMFFNNPMEGSEKPSWQSEIEGMGYFPMLVITKDESGDEVRFEATSVTKKQLSEDLFSPPSDFQKMDMPMMNFDNMNK